MATNIENHWGGEPSTFARTSGGRRGPLSFAQQRLWFLDQLVPNNPVYNIPTALKLEGLLNFAALEFAINEIVRRHEVLRARIEVEAGEPIQVIDTWEYRKLAVEDLTNLPREERDEVSRRILQVESMNGFDLSRGPLIRINILKLEEHLHVMLFTLHHIVSDAWSMEVLAQEIGGIYQARNNGQSSPFPELKLQYIDYAAWQRERLAEDVVEKEVEYWKRQLQGAVAMNLPTDYPRPAAPSYRGGCESVKIRRETQEALKKLGQKEGATIFMVLMAAFKTLLMRYSGEEDIVVGTAITNRNQRDVVGLIGFFVNSLAIRTDLSGNPGFRELIRRERTAALGAYAHQEVPFEKLVEDINPERDLSRSPLFNVMFQLHHVRRKEFEVRGLKVTWLDSGAEIARFDLTLELTESNEGITGHLEYSHDLYRAETIRRAARHYERIVEEVVRDADQRIRKIELLSKEEKKQIIEEWNATEAAYPKRNLSGELFEEWVEKTPHAIALVHEDRSLTYDELNAQAHRLAHRLKELGVGPEARVAICLERSLEMVVALLATLKAEGAYVPLDPAYPSERLVYMLEDSAPAVLLTHGPLKSALADRLPTIPMLDLECNEAEWIGQSEQNPGLSAAGSNAGNLAYVIYTSGSTGKPKGVMVEHRGVCNLAEAQKEIFELDANSQVLQFASVSFDASVSEIFSTLAAGASLFLYARENLQPGNDLAKILKENQITTVTLPPSVLSALGEVELNNLKTVIAAGEACSAQIVDRWSRGRRFLNAYGPTEATVCASVGEGRFGAEEKPSIGRPIKNTRLYILDDQLNPAPVGVPGELYIAGVGLARGYLGKPQLTAERFNPDPFSAEGGGRLYRTGDVVRYRMNGEVEFIGRADHQVKIRGYRIELGEIEARLSSHPNVSEAVVTANEEEERGKRLVAYYTGQDVGTEALRAHLAMTLPDYMMPSFYVHMERLPLTLNGKPDRRALPAPDTSRAERKDSYLTPQTPLEQIVAGIFEEVLKLELVGKKENFFEMGGHSLLATQVVSRIRKIAGVEIGVRSIFENPTAEGLSRSIAKLMQAGEKIESPPLVRTERGSDGDKRFPLSFAQQRLWFIAQMNPGDTAYNLPGSVRLNGGLKLDVLEQAINEVIKRHEVFRTRFEIWAGEPVQVVAEWEPRKLEVTDLTGIPSQERAAAVVRKAREEAETTFDLERGPLFRMNIFKLEEAEHVLLYNMHHIVSDEWSTEILIKEVGTLYQACLEGKASPLPELEIQYADFAVWQRKYLSGKVLDREVEYWREQLRDAAVSELPTDRLRPAASNHHGHRGAWERLELGDSVIEGLRMLSRREGATLFMTVMAAFKVVLMRYCGQEDVSVGTAIANRTRQELEGLIGFFVNTLVMRTDLSGNPSFCELLRRERGVALGAYAHQEAPFEKLVEEINPERDLSRNPLFQVMMLMARSGRETFELPGVKLSGISLNDGMETIGEGQSVKFDLTLTINDLGTGLTGVMEYSLDLFEAGTIKRLLNHYSNALAGVVKDSETPIWSLDLLSEGERKQIIEEWNAVEADSPKVKLIHELFEDQAAENPHTIALAYKEQSLTYGTLNARANRLAHCLREYGVGAESRVAICMDRGLEMIVTLLATLKAGGAYVPLDPAYPIERLAYMLEDSAPVILLTQGAAKSMLSGRLHAIPMLDLERDEAQWVGQSDQNPGCLGPRSDAQSLAYIIYTSGSTGTPKGVMVGHANIVRLMKSTEHWFGFGPDDVWTLFHSYAFDFSVWELWGALAYGGRLIIVPQAIARSSEEFDDLLRRNEVTVLNQTPSAFRQLILAGHGKTRRHNLRHVIFGGEALDVGMLKLWYERNENQPTALVNMYGITETTVHVTHRRLEPADAQRIGTSPIGCRIPDLNTYILDGHGQLVPIGVKGELHIGGAGVARGYLNRPELTAERFQPDTFGRQAGARTYKSGDLGRWLPEGEIDFLGRNDSQVKIRGFRVELGEIEAKLAEHSNVEDAVVVAGENGAGIKRLIAYYTGPEIEAQVLHAHLSRELPDYMVPAAYMRLEKLPLTLNGKLDRHKLPVPEGTAYVRHAYEEPEGEIESKMAQIWADVLKVERVGRHDSFFALGGHSLLVIRTIKRMRSEGLKVEAQTLFRIPTLSALAETIKNSGLAEVKTPSNLIPEGCQTITPEMLPLITLTQPEIDVITAMTPGGAANIQDIYPLAPLQEGILFHHLMNPDGDAYLLWNLLAFDTWQRLEVFLGAMQSVIDRHDILRTAIVWEGLPEPMQVVWRKASLSIEEVSFDSGNGDVATELLARFNPRRYRFDVHQAPLMRVCFTRDARKGRLVVLYLFHHLLADHTTFEALRQEIRAHLLGRVEQELPPPFRNFVAQSRLAKSWEEHEKFFKAMLADVNEPTTPYGLANVQGDGSGIKEAWLRIDPALAARMRQTSRALGVSSASLCHLAWALVLARASGREDVVFGTVLFGRMQGDESAGKTLGLFINTLPLRIRLGEEGAARSVTEVHRLLSELIEHEHASLVLAQRCSGVEAPAPLFSALLNYRHSSEAAKAGEEAGLKWEGVEVLALEERTNYPLTLSIDDFGDGFMLVAQTAAPADPVRVCEMMRTALERLSSVLEKAPTTPTRALDVLPEAERRQVVQEWNTTEVNYPKEKYVHELFEEMARQRPEAIALVDEEQSLTYSELNARADWLAQQLIADGIEPEDVVALAIPRSVEMVVGLLGIMKTGAAYLPVDPDSPAERVTFMLEDAGVALVLTISPLRERWPQRFKTLSLDELERAVALDQFSLHKPNIAGRVSTLPPHHHAYVIYTSGSTGFPKGVVVCRQGLANYVAWASRAYEADSGEGAPINTALAFDATVTSLFLPLIAGRRVHLLPENRQMETLAELLSSGVELTLVKLTPAHLQMLRDLLGVTAKAVRVRRFVVGGEALSNSVARFWQEHVPELQIVNEYGPTETVVGSCVYYLGPETELAGDVPIGRPIWNTRMYVLDSSLRPVPIGVVGELYIAGAGLAQGYLKQPALTAERFVADFFSECGERMYRTGDLARWREDGNLEFLGRNDSQVKIRGFRVELGEIEARLTCVPNIREAVVTSQEDGEGGKRLVAYYTGEKMEVEALREHLASVLPGHMMPAAYVHLERLPLTPNGKLDRRALPAPDLWTTEERNRSQAPQTPLEQIVVGIFEETLKLNLVGRRENFFELGGHSLLATRVISQIRKLLGVEIGLKSVFEEPTAEGLSRKIEEVMKGGEKSLAPPLLGVERAEEKGGRFPLSYAQQRLWFIDRLNPGSPVYNISGAVMLEGVLSLEALERSINEIVRRHEILRTRIEIEAGEPVQVIDRWEPRGLEVEDLASIPLEERELEVRRRAREEVRTGFDLSRGPLLRIKVLKLEEERHALLYTMHHIVSDGWSMKILIEELGAFYGAYSIGGTVDEARLPELEIQYADYAVWQRSYLAGEALMREVGYWREQLKDVVVLELPPDRPRPARPSYQGSWEGLELGQSLIEGLRSLSRREGATLFMTLMAAFKVVLMRYSGQEDISVGTAIANRTRKEVEGLIGFFVNTLVMRTDLSGNPSFRELLKREREAALGAYAHQDLPFEKLVEELNPGRDLSRNPLFQVMMALNNTGQEELKVEGLKLIGIEGREEVARFDLNLNLIEERERVLGALGYSSDLYDGETIRRMAKLFEKAVTEVARDAEQQIQEIDLLSDGEKKQLIEEWNETEKDFGKLRLIPELISEQAEQSPDRIAVIAGGQVMSYGELNRRANQLGNYLRGLGVGPETRVGLCLERNLGMVAGLLGILKAGAAYLPLDPTYPSERLAYMLEDAQASVVLSQQKLAENLSGQGRPVIYLDSDWEQIVQCLAEPLTIRPHLSNIAYVIFTSGSTGKPKGVAVEHEQILNYVAAIIERLEIISNASFAMVQPLTFDSCATVIYPALMTGGCLHVLSKDQATDPRAFSEYFNQHEIDLLKITPSHLGAMQTGISAEQVLPRRWLVIGGESSSSEWVERLRKMRPQLRILSHYGPTEATVGMLTYDVGRDRTESCTTAVPVGRPLANTQAYMLDRLTRPVPVGARSELYIGGLCVARGYLNHPEITAERFIPDLYGKQCGRRLYKTGDQVRLLPDGNIEFLGRLDKQVKIRGFRIELGEIESALLQHEGIREAAVTALGGEAEEKRLVAYLAPNNGKLLKQSELRSYLRQRLPDYMMPAAFVVMEKLPLMSNGKLDHRALPAPDGFDDACQYEPPIGMAETLVARIWAEILKLERVSRNDNFFELGGHSLLAIKLNERMRQEGLRADVRSLFTNPTLAAFAVAVGSQNSLVEVPPNRIPAGCAAITPEMLSLVQLNTTEIELIVRNTPGGAANVQDIYPLTPMQEGILFHYLLGVNRDPYLGWGLYRFDSHAQLNSFLQALQSVIDRHDILRTGVQWDGLPEPVQVVWRQAPLAIEEIRFDTAAGDCSEQLQSRFDPRHYRLDISRAPMMRACIAPDDFVRDAENGSRESWLMLLLYQHMIVDHVTMDILLKEIHAHLLGQTDHLTVAPPFRNFVAQARLGISREEHQNFFRKMLGDIDSPTAPYGLMDVEGAASNLREAQRQIDAEMAGRLRRTARTLGVSPASLCHLAWARVLGRLSGREDVVFGTILFGRLQGGEGVEQAPGIFINTLPIRIQAGAASVEVCVRQTHQLLTDLMRHEHASLALAQRCSAAPGPLFNALLNYRHSIRADDANAGTGEPLSKWEGIELLHSEERTNYPLVMSVDDWGLEFTLNAQVESSIDPNRICAYLYTTLERLVETLARSPSTSARDLDILPDWERDQLLIEWNSTQVDFPPLTCLQHLFEDKTSQLPDSIAVVFDDSYLSYAELNRRANQLARHLQESGVGPEVKVGICLERSLEMVIGLLGTLKAGGAYTPMDTAYPNARLKIIADDAGLRFILTDERQARRFSERSAALICIDKDWRSISTQSPDNLQVRVGPDNAAYVIFTSGSTGRPKGVLVTHRSVLNLFNAIDAKLHFSENDVWTMFHSYAFDFSVWEMWGALIYGGTVVVVPQFVARAPEEFFELVDRKGVTILSQTPSAFRHFNQAGEAAGPDRALNLRAVIFGGEALEFQMLKGWMERRGNESPQLINMYGITETTVHTTYKQVTTDDLKEAFGSVIGKPLANMRLYLFDNRLQPAPPGVIGELHVAGCGLARGYTRRGELTADRFRPAPYGQPGERIYITGDLARYLNNGEIEYLGRKDDQVKIRGYRIELGEIELALMQHEAIAEVAVIATGGAGEEKRLIAYPVARNGSQLNLNGLRSYLKEKLPDYMVPAAIVPVEALPLTPNGKLDRNGLPKPGQEFGEGERDFVAPQTPIEEVIAGVFEELLKLDRVGAYDDFFEAGGHSLLAIQLISRIRNAFQVEVGIRHVFDSPTVKGLAGKIEEAIKAGEKDETLPLVRVEREGRGERRLPLSFAQQRLWFIEQLEPGKALYNIPGALRLEGRFDLEVLERVINEIVRRHETLRTRFEAKDGVPFQVIDEWKPWKLEVIDLRSLPREEREAEIERRKRDEAETGFDLEHWPLLRVKALILAEEQHLALFSMHHIISDRWSMGVLIKEVGTLYQAFIAGEPSPLPELEIQYSDYTLWQRQWLQGEVLEQQTAYWKRLLVEAPAQLLLPTDRPRSAVTSDGGALESFVLSAELSRRLKRLSRDEDVTLFMTMLASFQLLLARYSGQERIVVGTPVAGRNRKETEALIGFFVNTLVMVTDLSGNPTARELLKRVREAVIGAFTHQDLPFEKLVEEVQPERDLSRQPLFQVMFTFQNQLEDSLEIANLRGESEKIEIKDAKFEISFAAEEKDDLLSGFLEYASDLYERESITRLLEHFERLLEGITSNRECRILDLPLLSEMEWKQVLAWNRTAAAYPSEKCIHQLFEEQAHRRPDRIAGIAEAEAISYGELNRRANHLGNYLRALSIGPEVRAGLCLERGVEMLVGLLGILKAGGAYVPLDPTYPVERLRFMLADAAAPLIVTQEKMRAELGISQAELICIDSDRQEIFLGSEENPESGVTGENLAYVIYTSGSTGRPKGAMITHQSAVNLVTDAITKFRLTPDSRFLQFASLSFDVTVEEIYPVWAIGGAVVLLPDNLSYSYSELTNTIERHGVTTAELPTAYWREWMRELLRLGRKAPGCLDLLITGDEVISVDVFREWKELEVPLWHVYGVTEVTVNSMGYRAPSNFGEDGARAPIPIGKPMANTEVYLLDNRLQLMPPRIPSEMYLGGAGLARGYLNRPELTAEKFIPSLFGEKAGSRLYKTGDLALCYPTSSDLQSQPDGGLNFAGRIDHQIKVRGYRVELGEIEAALKSHPLIEEAVVTAVENGSGHNKLVAYVAPKYEYKQALDHPDAAVEEWKVTIPELWPACGEYGIFDEVLYYAMTNDQVRNKSYREAMRQLVSGKTVVDIGAGADAVLSRMCIEAGARKVYAIEMSEDAYLKAKREIEREGLEDRVRLIHGESIRVELPEKVDVCVSELIGTIGSAEGAVPLLNDARRFLKDDGVMIPERCLTKIAAVELPEHIRRAPAFTEMSGHYVAKVFEQRGRQFDLRLCIRNFPKRNLISTVDLFETLDFKKEIELGHRAEVHLRINRKAKLEGLLLWINLEVIDGEVIDILEYDGCFSPAYLPVFSPGVEVVEGDEIRAICSATYRHEGGRPDYQLKGVVIKGTGERIDFDYCSRLEETAYRGNEFYKRLLRDDGININTKPEESLFPKHLPKHLPKYLQDHIREILPAYMMPSSFVTLNSFPLLPNGKVNRRALPAPDTTGAEARAEYQPPPTPVEEIVTGIFQEVLKLDQVGRKTSFFELGGHSLLATQAISRVRKLLGVEIGLRSVFERPTAAGLARIIEEKMRAEQQTETLPLARASRTERLPLSFAQQRLWFLDRLNPGSAVYNLPGATRLEGALNLDALERAINEIVRRHEVLRTRIEVEAGEPWQVIARWEPQRLEVTDLMHLPQEERETEANRIAKEEAETGFDLRTGPLLRVKLLKLEEDQYLLLHTMHHIVSDGWSMGILTGELSALYRAYSKGWSNEESPLAELPVQYADFAVWQRAWLQGETLERELRYWRERLAGAEDLMLPIDRPRPAVPTYQGASQRFVIEGDLAEKLRELARRQGVTLFMTLLAGFDVLMSRYTGQAEILIGTDIANRNRAEIEGLIGFFVNQLALKTEVKAEERFSLLLNRVRDACLGAYAHQDLPFEKLVEELQPERNLGRSPLFQVKLVGQNTPGENLELEGIRLSGNYGEITTARFDLTISLTDAERVVGGLVEYSRDLFLSSTIDRLIGHYLNVLSGIAADSERRILDLDLLSRQEREQLLLEWNQTERPFSEHRRIHELIQEQAESASERIALVCEAMMVSYGELNRRANRLGNYLKKIGIGPEIVVGLCLERSAEMVVAVLGTLKAGGAYLPLDPESPLDRLSFMLADAAVAVTLTERKIADRLPAFWGQTVCLDAEWERIGQQSDVQPACEVNAGNLAYVIYTSGSTGKPKGVMVEHRGVCNLAEAQKEIFGLNAESQVLQFASMSFDASVSEIFSALAAGASLSVHGREALRPGNDLVQKLREDQITTVTLPPSVLSALGEVELNNLETVIAAGEACPAEIVDRWAEGRRFLNAYGPTEATVCASVGEGRFGAEEKPGIGRPIKNTRLYILDDQLNPAPVGVPGELYIAGVGLARGYLGRPELTAERFNPDLFNAEGGGRLYRTGDVVRYRMNGEVEFIGRADHQVKMRGYRIEPGEIEAVLNEHRSVQQSVVVARGDEAGDQRLVAYVVGDKSISPAELKRHAQEKLPAYMTPTMIVVLEQMPMTPSGKLNRQALPLPEGSETARAYEAPAGPIEIALAQIWADALKLERIGRHDHFFELGGHSLLAVSLIEQMHGRGLRSDVRTLFSHPTLAGFAAAIEDVEVVL